MAIYELDGKRPVIASDAYIHPQAVIIGEVTLGSSCFVGPGVVIRADFGPISIGSNTNIQDNSVLHVTAGDQIIVDENVLIAHSVILHDAHIHPYCLIGMGAVLLRGVICEEQVLVAAGSVVSQGMHIPSRKLVAGNPAKIIKEVSPDYMSFAQWGLDEYKRISKLYRETLKEVPR
jgi:carbonic anhydrase/acetyltransferase-like protein (isoleucine patch superfamily)